VVFLGCGLIFSFFVLLYLAEIKGERLHILNENFSYRKRAEKMGSRVAPSDRPRLGHSSPIG
jgi:hypothetical protein